MATKKTSGDTREPEEKIFSAEDAPARLAEANAILARAFEGGYFEAWVGQCWQLTKRDEMRQAARGLLGPLAEGLTMRLDIKARDVYRDGKTLPKEDWDKAKDARLARVYATANS